MTDKEIREEIEGIVKGCLIDFDKLANGKSLEETCEIINELDEKYSLKILTLIKEAGYLSREEVQTYIDNLGEAARRLVKEE